MECVLSIDLGTQSVRLALYNLEGQAVISVSKSYETHYPAPGLAEQEPKTWWTSIKAGIEEIMNQRPNNAIIAIVSSATSSTVIPVDLLGNALTKAILWMDNRAIEQARRINKTAHPVLKWCGGEVSPEWFLPKLLWIKESCPEIYQKAYRIVEALDWLNYKLTGNWVSSQCNASCKWNYLPGEGWIGDFFELVGIPEFVNKVPAEVVPVGGKIGTLSKNAAVELNLKEGTPVIQGGIDAHIATIGLGSFEEGEASLILGSSSVLLINTKHCEIVPGFWGPYREPLHKGFNLLEGGQVSSGSILCWFVEKIVRHYLCEARESNTSPFALLDSKALNIEPGSAGLVVLDHWQGNRSPYKDPTSRGIIYGLTLGHDDVHLWRAIYEGISFGIRLIIDSLVKEGIQVRKIRVCGGGVKSNLWLQILADVCAQTLEVTDENMTLLGGAIVGATGVGIFSSFREGFIKMQPKFKNVFPQVTFSSYQSSYERYCKLYLLSKELSCQGGE